MKALACELPATSGLPLSRFSTAEIARQAVARGIVCEISGATVWRWLAEDAVKPWQYRSWIFPRDPAFREKAARLLDLYEDRWEGRFLHPADFVLCADESPRSRHAGAGMRPCPRPAGAGRRSSTTTSAWAPSATCPPGT